MVRTMRIIGPTFVLLFLLLLCNGQTETPAARPRVVITGQNLSSETGSTVVLHCDISMIPPQSEYTVRWATKGDILSDGIQLYNNDPRFSIMRWKSSVDAAHEVYSLTIAEVTRGDNGVYTCHYVYSLDNGVSYTSTSTSAHVFIIDEFPVCSTSLQQGAVVTNTTLTVEVDSNIDLLCEATMLDDSYSLRWYYAIPSGLLRLISGNSSKRNNVESLQVSVNATENLNGSMLLCIIWNKVDSSVNFGCSVGPIYTVEFLPLDPTTSSPPTSSRKTESLPDPPVFTLPPPSSLPIFTLPPDASNTDMPPDNRNTDEDSSQGPVAITTQTATNPSQLMSVISTFPVLVWVAIAIGSLAFLLCLVFFIIILVKWNTKPDSRIHTSAAPPPATTPVSNGGVVNTNHNNSNI